MSPLCSEPPPEVGISNRPLEPDILLVEDEPAFRTLLRDFLRHEGYSVQEASDGWVALRFLAQHRARLVVTDMFMPEADGVQVLSRARRMQPTIPVIVMAGSATWDLAWFQRVSQLLGAERTLTKPFPLGQLLTA